MLINLVIGVIYGVAYALLAVGVVLIYRGSRVLNFAQGEIGTFSLYLAWVVTVQHHQPWIVGALTAVVGAGLLGFAFERFVVRPMTGASRLSVAVATIGLLTFLVLFEANMWSPDARTLPAPLVGAGVRVLGYVIGPSQLLSFFVVIVLAAALALLLRYTDFGLGVQAAAEDATTAAMTGVRVGRVSAFTWIAACVIAAIAALLIEPSIGVFAPGYMSRIFVFALAAALVGGLNSLPGAFVGGIAVGVLDSELSYVLRSTPIADLLSTRGVPGIDSLVVFGVIVAVLLLRPNGFLAGRRLRAA